MKRRLIEKIPTELPFEIAELTNLQNDTAVIYGKKKNQPFVYLKKTNPEILVIVNTPREITKTYIENSRYKIVSAMLISAFSVLFIVGLYLSYLYINIRQLFKAIMAISKADSVDSFGVGQVNINIEKKPFEGDFATFVNSTYEPMKYNNDYDLVSSGSTTIAGNDALEYIYTSNENGVQKQHKAVWFEKGGQAYVLLYSAPLDKFESNLYVFDYIVSDIRIT